MNASMIIGALVLAQTAAAPGAPPAVADTAALVSISEAPASAAATTVRLPALTPVRLRVIGEVNSKTNAKGDKVAIVLVDALVLSPTLAIPAGTRGIAEVIHAAKGGMGGKAGELLVAARHLELAPGVQIPLRSFRLAPVGGKNNEGLAMGLSIAGGVAGGLAAMVITGGSARIADGSEAFAKTAADVDLPISRLQVGPSPADVSVL